VACFSRRSFYLDLTLCSTKLSSNRVYSCAYKSTGCLILTCTGSSINQDWSFLAVGYAVTEGRGWSCYKFEMSSASKSPWTSIFTSGLTTTFWMVISFLTLISARAYSIPVSPTTKLCYRDGLTKQRCSIGLGLSNTGLYSICTKVLPSLMTLFISSREFILSSKSYFKKLFPKSVSIVLPTLFPWLNRSYIAWTLYPIHNLTSGESPSSMKAAM